MPKITTSNGKSYCNINIPSIIKIGVKQLGIVFNLDKHYQSGSHWVSIYIGLNPKSANYGCYYFDSNGIGPTTEINTLFNNISSQMKLYDPKNHQKFHVTHNTIQKQFKNTECGMFSIYFILSCLQKKSFKSITENSIYDDDVFKLRSVLFR